MKIVGFGDSFIQSKNTVPYQYTQLVIDKFGGDYELFGVNGGGIWDTFFEFKRYTETNPNFLDVDLILFAWSDASRLYNSEVRNACYANSLNHKDSKDPFWIAVKYYYEYIFDIDKTRHEFDAFFYWVDDWLNKHFPNKKIINMYSFPKMTTSSSVYFEYLDIVKHNPENEIYYHEFKNSVTIKPSLLHFSLNDEWPEDNDLSREHRFQHLTPKMHKEFSKVLIESIEGYEKGKVFTYKPTKLI